MSKKNNDNKRYFPLRDPENPFKVTLTPITEEQYRSLYPDIWATQKREQYHGRCMCTKRYLWKCDGQCDLCEYHAPDTTSLDEPLPDGIQARLEELQKELIKKANNKQDYDAIADEIFRLRDQKEQSELDSHHREEAMNRIKELQDFISGQETDITEFDEALVKKLIEKITVFADHFTVEFKSGITIDIEA